MDSWDDDLLEEEDRRLVVVGTNGAVKADAIAIKASSRKHLNWFILVSCKSLQ